MFFLLLLVPIKFLIKKNIRFAIAKFKQNFFILFYFISTREKIKYTNKSEIDRSLQMLDCKCSFDAAETINENNVIITQRKFATTTKSHCGHKLTYYGLCLLPLLCCDFFILFYYFLQALIHCLYKKF